MISCSQETMFTAAKIHVNAIPFLINSHCSIVFIFAKPFAISAILETNNISSSVFALVTEQESIVLINNNKVGEKSL